VDENLRPLSIVDEIIRDLRGRIVNYVDFGDFTVGRELQSHVVELKASRPFDSPKSFEEIMQDAVLRVSDFLEKTHGAHLLGLGMHPFMKLDEAKVWSHRDRQIYASLNKIFNLNQHGWLNIQSFQLNLSYSDEVSALKLYNALANILPYVPAISASSPIYESKIGEFVDNRLFFYEINQKEVPSIAGDIIPEYVNSFEEYKKITVERYSQDLMRMSAPRCIMHKEWLNSRGAVIRSDRKAIEIRVMDEQECIKSDVALSCFMRSLLRSFIRDEKTYLPNNILTEDFKAVIRDGLDAKVQHPRGDTARNVCRYFYKLAWESASSEEKEYLGIVGKRIDEGNLSNLILRDVAAKSKRKDFREAIQTVYSSMIKNLVENKVYT